MKAFKSGENKQDIKSIEGIFPKDMRTNEVKNEIHGTKKWEEKIRRKDLKYETKNTHIYIRKSSKVEAEEDQRNLLDNLVEFNNRSRPKKQKREG